VGRGEKQGVHLHALRKSTLAIAEQKIAALEGAEAAVVTASGMAAISSALLGALKSGDELISTAQLYGGTYRLMRDVFGDLGIKVHHVGTDLAGIEDLVNSRTRVLYVESPTNPTVRLVDVAKAAQFAKKHNLISIIDNTFATPLLQQPIKLGYDMVVHSATKALAGHSDVIAGVAVGNKKWMERVQHMVIYLGGSMDPEAAYLLNRGIRRWDCAFESNARMRWPSRSFWRSIQSRSRVLSGALVASGLQTGEAANARIRLDARVRFEGRPACGASRLRSRTIVFAGGEPWRRGVACGFAGVYSALQHDGGRIDARRSDSWHGARVHRH